jgi:hypothetical protein
MREDDLKTKDAPIIHTSLKQKKIEEENEKNPNHTE